MHCEANLGNVETQNFARLSQEKINNWLYNIVVQ